MKKRIMDFVCNILDRLTFEYGGGFAQGKRARQVWTVFHGGSQDGKSAYVPGPHRWIRITQSNGHLATYRRAKWMKPDAWFVASTDEPVSVDVTDGNWR